MLKPTGTIIAIIVLLSFSATTACTSATTSGGTTEGSEATEFEEDQPRYPTNDDDPFFHESSELGEVFRVLITRGNYQVRQVRYEDRISRVPDTSGDREMWEFFKDQHDKIDFRDWNFEGTIRLRLSPLTGDVEHISYVHGQTPRTWQASKFFQDDVSRFQYEHPAGSVSVREFRVRYEWRINAREGLSEEEQRARAIEWLREQRVN